MNIDVGNFPRQAMYGPEGEEINLASIVQTLSPTFYDWGGQGLVKATESFGFAAVDLSQPLSWYDPQSFVWFVVGWGPEGDRYIANAVRKLRPALRLHSDTLYVRINASTAFRDVVPSVDDDGNFPWGDFPYGGATFVQVGNLRLLCAVSCYREVEDDTVAKTIGSHIGATMLRLDHPELFG